MSAQNSQLNILTALVVLQIVAMAFLIYRLVGIDASIGSIAADGENEAVEHARVATLAGQPTPETSQPVTVLTAPEVRRIVREELRSQIDALAFSTGSGGNPTAASDPRDEFDYQQQYELIDQELEFHINQGTISDADMAALQQEIAKLDPEGREEMLRRIVRALNSGELDGRL